MFKFPKNELPPKAESYDEAVRIIDTLWKKYYWLALRQTLILYIAIFFMLLSIVTLSFNVLSI